MSNYYVATCKVCKWQWSVKSDDGRKIAVKGCPACRAGSGSIVIEEETRDSNSDE